MKFFILTIIFFSNLILRAQELNYTDSTIENVINLNSTAKLFYGNSQFYDIKYFFTSNGILLYSSHRSDYRLSTVYLLDAETRFIKDKFVISDEIKNINHESSSNGSQSRIFLPVLGNLWEKLNDTLFFAGIIDIKHQKYQMLYLTINKDKIGYFTKDFINLSATKNPYSKYKFDRQLSADYMYDYELFNNHDIFCYIASPFLGKDRKRIFRTSLFAVHNDTLKELFVEKFDVISHVKKQQILIYNNKLLYLNENVGFLKIYDDNLKEIANYSYEDISKTLSIESEYLQRLGLHLYKYDQKLYLVALIMPKNNLCSNPNIEQADFYRYRIYLLNNIENTLKVEKFKEIYSGQPLLTNRPLDIVIKDNDVYFTINSPVDHTRYIYKWSDKLPNGDHDSVLTVLVKRPKHLQLYPIKDISLIEYSYSSFNVLTKHNIKTSFKYTEESPKIYPQETIESLLKSISKCVVDSNYNYLFSYLTAYSDNSYLELGQKVKSDSLLFQDDNNLSKIANILDQYADLEITGNKDFRKIHTKEGYLFLFIRKNDKWYLSFNYFKI